MVKLDDGLIPRRYPHSLHRKSSFLYSLRTCSFKVLSPQLPSLCLSKIWSSAGNTMNCLLTGSTQISLSHTSDYIQAQFCGFTADVTPGVCKVLLELFMQTKEAPLYWILRCKKNWMKSRYWKAQLQGLCHSADGIKDPWWQTSHLTEIRKGTIYPIRTFQKEKRRDNFCLSVRWFCLYEQFHYRCYSGLSSVSVYQKSTLQKVLYPECLRRGCCVRNIQSYTDCFQKHFYIDPS